MTKIDIRYNYEQSPRFWKNFYIYCSDKSNDFKGVSVAYYMGSQLAELGALWVCQGGDDYRRDMWLEFCSERDATVFLLRFS